ncbi:MAG TPA: aminodeoxychorismate/anthranilate synthase component II [Blastocatellia bacterium]|jgi:anthranilate synthase/aminodeoxychorismate synthase-like glutamine amidotransferase|nr:aminodeoxychorismate/anthranilate synthase component II [Blastocatellia bacterium]
MILVIDNYDSFTYNLVQYLGELGVDLPVARAIEVARNDRITIEEIEKLSPERIVLSPGPCTPDDAGITLDVIRHFAGKVPLLGVCLGHQAMGQAFGGRVVRAPYLMHGKTSQILHDGRTVFDGVENPFTATRYHSLIVDRSSVPPMLEVSATTSDGLVMGLRHREFICEGVQFHPESIMTVAGKRLLGNFLKL